jgi:hypothetical protein
MGGSWRSFNEKMEEDGEDYLMRKFLLLLYFMTAEFVE